MRCSSFSFLMSFTLLIMGFILYFPNKCFTEKANVVFFIMSFAAYVFGIILATCEEE